MKDDIARTSSYVVEFGGGNVIAVSKAKRDSDIAVDMAESVHFKDLCMGKSPIDCEQALGVPPSLVARNVATNQLVELFDARLVASVQKPYSAVLRFDPNDLCSDIRMVKVVASSTSDPTQ